jgi:hypothetical protein
MVSLVGMSLGTRLGKSLGTRLGKSLGTRLGKSLGIRLGISLGILLSNSFCLSAARLGEPLGTRLGKSLGIRLGIALGIALSNSFCFAANRLGEPLGNTRLGMTLGADDGCDDGMTHSLAKGSHRESRLPRKTKIPSHRILFGSTTLPHAVLSSVSTSVLKPLWTAGPNSSAWLLRNLFRLNSRDDPASIYKAPPYMFQFCGQ